MKRKTIWLILSCLLVLSLILASCGTKTTETTTTATVATTVPTTGATTTKTTQVTSAPVGNWWEKFGTPEYGGTITFRTNVALSIFDPYWQHTAGDALLWYYETVGGYDWLKNRDAFSFDQGTYVPSDYRAGLLAESWEQPDLQTVIFHLHEGVHFQDIAPVNGREFVADDVVYHWNRQKALGGGFTSPSPYRRHQQYMPMESVTATDKYTVVFKWTDPSLEMWNTLMDPYPAAHIEAKEAVDYWGDINDWTRAIGTGPWILKDFISGASVTYVKNPNYWGYDERYPNNKLPYFDSAKILIIPDDATAMSAMRTGKIVVMGTGMGTMKWETGKELAKTNPEIVQTTIKAGGNAMEFRCDMKPFTDIRVRTALQMAIDFKTIVNEYYGGNADPDPYGMAGPALLHEGYTIPFSKWSKELQDEYTYNVEGAKKLLADAGYPTGFKTNVLAPTTADKDLLQIVKAMFLDVGVDMEIKIVDSPTFTTTLNNAKQDQMSWGATGYQVPPWIFLNRRYSTHQLNYTHNNDKTYDAIVDKYYASVDLAEAKQLCIDADQYVISQHWAANLPVSKTIIAYHPWWKGYSGENFIYAWDFIAARTWIDEALKKSSGY